MPCSHENKGGLTVSVAGVAQRSTKPCWHMANSEAAKNKVSAPVPLRCPKVGNANSIFDTQSHTPQGWP